MSDQDFSVNDMQLITQILENQPLQNMAAARNIGQLIHRFQGFCASHLAPPPPAPAAKGRKGKPDLDPTA